jgi:hypothetical protein
MSTITNSVDGATITPALVLGYATARQSATVLHWVIGRPDPDVTLRQARLRSGTLELLFATEAQAALCASIHARAAVFTLSDPDVSAVNMNYVTNGRIAYTLDPQTLKQWTVSVDYQEVSA